MQGIKITPCLKEYFELSDQFPYFLTDSHANCLYVNPVFTDFFGKPGGVKGLLHIFRDSKKLSQAIIDCLESGRVIRSRMLTMDQAGKLRNLVWEFSACFPDGQKDFAVQVIGSPEITTKRTAGYITGKMASRYKAYEQSPEGLWRFEQEDPVPVDADPDEILRIWEQSSYLAECNDTMARMYGYESASEITGTSLSKFIDFSAKENTQYLRTFIQNRFNITIGESREHDRYGNTRYFLNSMEGVVEEGMLVSVWGTQQDITGQRLAEEKIKYLAKLIENVSDIIISHDKDRKIVSWNRAAEDILGIRAEDAIGHEVPEIMEVEFQDLARGEFFDILNEKGFWKGETLVTTRLGKKVSLLQSVTTLRDEKGEISGYLSAGKDITEKRIAELQMRQSEAFYRKLISESQDGIVLADIDGQIQFAAMSVKKVLGYDTSEVIGKNIFDFVHPEDREMAREAFAAEKNDTAQSPFINARLAGKSGDYIWCVVRGHSMITDQVITSVVIYFYDDTERKRMHEALQTQAVALSNVFDLIITCDLRYVVQGWNKRAEQVVGYTESEVKGKFLGDIAKLDYSPFTAGEVAGIMLEKGNWQGEISFLNRHGERKYVLHTASFLHNEKGEKISIIGTGIDITEKKRAEKQVEESELFYRNLFINSLDGVLITDPSGTVKFASPSVTTIFGYTPDEIIGRKTFDYAHPDDQPLAEKAFTEELNGNPSRSFISVRIRNKSGVWVWCIVRGHNLLSNPYINGMLVYLYDDTLRKKTEEALIASESRHRTQAVLMRKVTDVIVVVNMDREVITWNKVIEKLTGISENEALGRKYPDVLKTSYHPFTDEQVQEIVKKEGIWRGELSFMGYDGETRYLLHTITLLRNENDEPSGMMGVGKDITERKRMEAHLQQSESFYRSLATNSLDGIVLTDENGKINYCGPSVPQVAGYPVTDLLGKNIFEFVHPSEHGQALDSFSKELGRESDQNYAVIRLKHATKGWVWCTVRSHNLLHDPVLRGIAIYFTDDSKRKMMEDRLRESESRFRNLIHNLKLGVILQNEKLEVLVCNQAALDLLGLTENQLPGSKGFDAGWHVIQEDGSDFPAHTHPVPMVIQTGKPVRDVVMGVYRASGNEPVWLLVNAEPVLDDNSNLINVISSFTDITEQKRFSQQLIDQEIQKQKLITQATIDGQEKERLEIGKELHDNINQHLTTTRLYLEVARDKTVGESRDMISQAEKNLAEIVKEIRRMSQSLVPPTLGDIGLVESVQDLCDSLIRTHSIIIEFHHRHFLETGIPDNMKLMLFRIIQEQVNNVIRHARAGRLVISLQLDAECIALSISDDGQGFDPQQHKRGMGLKNIINRAALFDGKVEIISAPGMGCEVQVSIPSPALDRI